MSARWILDANVFIRAQDDGFFDEVVAAASAADAVIAVAVRDEVGGLGPRKKQPKFGPLATVLNDSGIEIRDIGLKTHAFTVFAQLRANHTGSGSQGECACIALAAEDTELVFVTGEPKATFLAVAELEGRVRSIPSFFAAMVETGVLDSTTACSIVDGPLKNVKPSWWDTRINKLRNASTNPCKEDTVRRDTGC